MRISFWPGRDGAGVRDRMHRDARAVASSDSLGDGTMREEIAIVHSDPRALMTLAIALRGLRIRVTAVDPIRPITAAHRTAKRQPAAMIVSLDGDESIVEIREMLLSAPRTRFILLARPVPAPPTLARIVNGHGSTIVSQEESPIVVVATLIALLTEEARNVV